MSKNFSEEYNLQSYKTVGMGVGQVTRALVVMAQLKVI